MYTRRESWRAAETEDDKDKEGSEEDKEEKEGAGEGDKMKDAEEDASSMAKRKQAAKEGRQGNMHMRVWRTVTCVRVRAAITCIWS